MKIEDAVEMVRHAKLPHILSTKLEPKAKAKFEELAREISTKFELQIERARAALMSCAVLEFQERHAGTNGAVWDNIVEISSDKDVHQLGFCDGRLEYRVNEKSRPVTLKESVEVFANIEALHGTEEFLDGAHEPEAQEKWLRMIAAALP